MNQQEELIAQGLYEFNGFVNWKNQPETTKNIWIDRVKFVLSHLPVPRTVDQEQINYPKHNHPHGIKDVEPNPEKIWVCEECKCIFTDTELREDLKTNQWGHKCWKDDTTRCESHLEPYLPNPSQLVPSTVDKEQCAACTIGCAMVTHCPLRESQPVSREETKKNLIKILSDFANPDCIAECTSNEIGCIECFAEKILNLIPQGQFEKIELPENPYPKTVKCSDEDGCPCNYKNSHWVAVEKYKSILKEKAGKGGLWRKIK